jgi:hypothetical protein
MSKKQKADKKNSHTIPKFLNERLFHHSIHRHTIQIDIRGKEIKLQNTPSQDYLVCSQCEKRFENELFA